MADSRPVLCGHGEGIDFPTGRNHCVLKVSHEPPGGFRAAGARPPASGKVQSQDIEQRVALRRLQAAIRGSIGIVGIQTRNQLAVFLDNNPQREVREWLRMTALNLPAAARQRGS
jgi:hypothetical protein